MSEIFVYEFCDLCIEPSLYKVAIYRLNSEREVYRGPVENVPEKYSDDVIESWDMGDDGVLVLNID